MSALSMSLYDPKSGAKTPHLDMLAADGFWFENAYCNYPLCAPARFSLMSGRLPSAIGAYDNAAEFPASIPTVAHYLRANGYYTCLSGKMHFVGPDQLHGFEDRLTTEIYPADFDWTPRVSYDEGADDTAKDQPDPGVSGVETVADARAVARSMQLDYDEDVAHRAIGQIYELRRHDNGQPFFLTVSFTQPHDPYVVTRRYWDRYAGSDINAPRVEPLALDALDPHSLGLHFHYGLDRFSVDPATARRARHGYYAMMSYIDDRVGDILGALSEAGYADDTLVIFTSDHGDMMGERGMWFKKTLFEQAVRVPMIVRHPHCAVRGCKKTPVSLVDLLPTCLGAAGGTRSDLLTEVEGEDLLQLAEDQTADTRSVYVEHLDGATRAPRVMVRKGAYKYVYSDAYPPQLFDVVADPEQLVNLAGQEAHAVTERGLLEEVTQRWDLAQLKADVAANQRIRRFLADSLSVGRVETWEREPTVPSANRFVRRGDLFPDVERRGYVDYEDC
ncbi:MAG: choline-sulfatase [Chromatiales bacterium]|nr:choline-sulfatase [Chromatiales bacterium]